jgi:serine phosphatase RsbU (regulator of sigma subunit)
MLSRFRKAKPPTSVQPDAAPAIHVPLQGAEIAAVFYGQRQGGDYYDFHRVSNSRVIFGLLDVAGKRENNRGIVRAAQGTFRDLGKELFSGDSVNEAEAMVALCLELNRSIMQAAGGVRSCPGFIGCYNESLGTVCYINAGHTPGLVRESSGTRLLPATGLPMGLFPYATSDAPITAIEPGAALLLVSRGIVEGQRKREEFGIDRVKEAFQQSSASEAREIGMSILDKVQQYMHTPPTHNDVTALALVRSKDAAARND